MSGAFFPRPVRKDDYRQIQDLLQESNYVHRHLDWRHPLDLIDQQPFWVIENERGKLVAALACPPYPPGTAWINFFAASSITKPEQVWSPLLTNALEKCPPPGIQTLAVLPTQPWFIRFLPAHGFIHSQDIIILHWSGRLPAEKPTPPAGFIRPAEPADLTEILELDHSSFSPLWQLSEDNLRFAYQDSNYATVFLQDGLLAGYLIAGLTHLGGHISRLAVLDRFRSMGIGYHLVRDSLRHFSGNDINVVTVNTQSDNKPSQALYKKAGFLPTGERVAVFTYGF